MIAIVGLGNAGPQYADTKHNAGFWVVDELARRWNISFKPGKGSFVMAEKPVKNVVLIKPTTGMNVSGNAVKQVVQRWQLSLKDIMVVFDDVDLPVGTLRMRPRGGDGCHRGVESIIYRLGDQNFPRLRIGIATDENTRPAEKFVLRPFKTKDEAQAEEAIVKAADAIEMLMARGLNNTMNTVNQIEKSGKPD